MNDLNALSAIRSEKEKYTSFTEKLKSGVDLQLFLKNVRSTTERSFRLCEDTKIYIKAIQDEIQSLKDIIKSFTIHLGEKMKQLVESGYFEDKENNDYSNETRHEIYSLPYSEDTKAKEDARKKYEVEQARILPEYEEVANQQFNLQKYGIVSALKFWSGCLQEMTEAQIKRKAKEKEKGRKEEEERKYEKEHKRKKEEERRIEKQKKHEEEEEQRVEKEKKHEEEKERRIEKEKKQKEEDERKRKENMRRTDPNNWPTYKYYRGSDQGYHNGLCCVITVVEGNHGFTKEDLSCVSSDKPDDLIRCSENKEEVVVGSMVTIIPTYGSEFAFDVPMRIFVPHLSIENDKEIKLKISIDGSKWTYPEKIAPTSNLNEINIPLVGTSLVKFNQLEIAVVSRPKRESHVIKNNGSNAAEIRPYNNDNFIMRIPEGTFYRDICAHLKVDTGLASRVSTEPDFNHIRPATPLFGIEFDEYTQNDVTLDIQPNYIKKADSVYGRAIHHCANKLVTDMAVDDVIDKLQSKSIFKEQTIQKIQSEPSNEAKAMELLELFETASRSRFNALVESLSEAKQCLLVHYLQETLTDMKKSEIGSDFEDMKSSKLQLVSSNDSKEWKLMKFRPKSNLPNQATVIIPSNQRNFNLIGIEVPYDYPEDEICRVANEIYEMMYQVPVRLIVKQHAQRPSDLYIRCVEKSKSQDALREMASLGYKDGPVEMAELGLRDTEEVIFNASGDIKFLSGTTRMSFFLNVKSAYLSFQIIDVVNKEAQTLGRTYQGNLAYNVGDTPQPPPRSGSFLIQLPKEAQRYAPLMLDVPVKAAAKYLAWQLTKRGSPDPHDLYMKLCGGYGKKTVLKSLANIEGSTERKRCEAFIMRWASQRPKQEDKIKIILESIKELDQESLAKKTDNFLKPYINGPLSDNSIKEFSLKLDQKWEILARKLGFDDKYIDALNMDFENNNTRAVHLLEKWRLLDTTIELGTDITATLVKAMDSV